MGSKKEDCQEKKVQKLVDALSTSNADGIQEINFLKAYAHNILQQQNICKSFRIRSCIEVIIALILSVAGVIILIMELILEGMGVFSQNTMAIFCIVIVAILFEILSGLFLWLSKETIKQLKQYRDDLYKNQQLIFMFGIVDFVSNKKDQEKGDIRDLYMRVVESELRKREQSARL